MSSDVTINVVDGRFKVRLRHKLLGAARDSSGKEYIYLRSYHEDTMSSLNFFSSMYSREAGATNWTPTHSTSRLELAICEAYQGNPASYRNRSLEAVQIRDLLPTLTLTAAI